MNIITQLFIKLVMYAVLLPGLVLLAIGHLIVGKK